MDGDGESKDGLQPRDRADRGQHSAWKLVQIHALNVALQGSARIGLLAACSLRQAVAKIDL